MKFVFKVHVPYQVVNHRSKSGELAVAYQRSLYPISQILICSLVSKRDVQ